MDNLSICAKMQAVCRVGHTHVHVLLGSQLHNSQLHPLLKQDQISPRAMKKPHEPRVMQTTGAWHDNKVLTCSSRTLRSASRRICRDCCTASLLIAARTLSSICSFTRLATSSSISSASSSACFLQKIHTTAVGSGHVPLKPKNSWLVVHCNPSILVSKRKMLLQATPPLPSHTA